MLRTLRTLRTVGWLAVGTAIGAASASYVATVPAVHRVAHTHLGLNVHATAPPRLYCCAGASAGASASAGAGAPVLVLVYGSACARCGFVSVLGPAAIGDGRGCSPASGRACALADYVHGCASSVGPAPAALSAWTMAQQFYWSYHEAAAGVTHV